MTGIAPRGLTVEEAATYCGFVTKAGNPQVDRFRERCPIQPLPFSGRQHTYDRKALDQWLDELSGLHPTGQNSGDAFDEWQKGRVGAA